VDPAGGGGGAGGGADSGAGRGLGQRRLAARRGAGAVSARHAATCS
jgi:hypothetical protein